ncbi:hypothetical protein DFH06DRAFT_1131866 [Mycena polygramma]|nr:hypothetical protein DFH06DRAFT_1131866 [Mycena polygramma]
MTHSSCTRSGSCSSTSSELDELRKHTAYLRRKLRIQQQRQDEHNTQRTQRNALETKRCQWKAASARYYENHPEVRAKKRLKMAAQRAAKKLSRRKRDPPKTGNPLPRQNDQLEIDVGCAVSIINADREDSEDVHAAAESLLYLQRQTVCNPFPEDLPPSDEIPTSEHLQNIRSTPDETGHRGWFAPGTTVDWELIWLGLSSIRFAPGTTVDWELIWLGLSSLQIVTCGGLPKISRRVHKRGSNSICRASTGYYR